MGFLSDLWNGVTGSGAADAAKEGSQIQSESADKAIAFQKETRDLSRADLAPYNEFGQSQINPLLKLLTSEGQADYLKNNELFNASLDSVNKATTANLAAKGKLGSGGTLKALQNNYLSNALPFLDSHKNTLLNAVNMGQNSAAGQGSMAMNAGNSISNLITGQGNANAAGVVGAANANQQGWNNIVNTGLTAYALSDERLKTDIKEVDRDELGGIYEFRYNGSDQLYKGRLAQELAKTKPDAVTRDLESGYLMVTSEFAPVRAA